MAMVASWRAARLRITGSWAAALLVALAAVTTAAAQPAYQGFGAGTPGGPSSNPVYVTNLNDSGAGSLREALKAGNRTVKFTVGGEILLNDFLYVRGAYVTIDGSSAPAPGITLRNWSLVIAGTHGANNVIVRGIRVRNSANDGIMVKYGAHDVVIDHVSISGSADGNIDITQDARNVTVSWSILAGNKVNMLIKYNASRVSLHHNLFISALQRAPLVSMADATVAATDTIADFRNNLVWAWGSGSGYGTWVEHGARANVINNLYKAQGGSAAKALIVDASTSARVHTSGNVSADGVDLNRLGNEASPFPSAPVDTQTACAAAQLVVTGAGARPLDSVDQQYLAGIALPFCPGAASSLEISPSSVAFEAVEGGAPAPSRQLTVVEATGLRLGLTTTSTTTSGGSWLSVTPSSGTTPTTLTVTANSGGLADGTYHGTVVVTAPGAANSPWSIPVTLVVDPAPSSPSSPSPSPPPPGAQQVEVAVASKADDSREAPTGVVVTNESFIAVGGGNLTALRFANVPLPRNAVIQSAFVELYVVAGTGNLSVRYSAEDAGDSAPITSIVRSLSRRTRTLAFVDDTPDPWSVGAFTTTPDLGPVIQEVVDRLDWEFGNGLTLFIQIIEASLTRKIGTFETSPSPNRAAVLTVVYQLP